VCKLSALIASLELANFFDFIIHVQGLCGYVQQLLVMIGIVPFTLFCLFVLFGFVCCRLCITSWFLCFRQRLVLELGRTFSIAMLKLALFDWFYVCYLGDVILYQEAFGIGKKLSFRAFGFLQKSLDFLFQLAK